MSIEDTLIESYAHKLQEMYDKRLAGDHSFTGVLATFLLDVYRERGFSVETPAKAPESPVEAPKRFEVNTYRVRSSSDFSQTYTVMKVIDTDLNVTWACSCPAWTYSKDRGACKHIREIMHSGARPVRKYATDTYPVS